jgi:hypothetical protein
VELLKEITGFAHVSITMSAFILAMSLNPVRTRGYYMLYYQNTLHFADKAFSYASFFKINSDYFPKQH